MLSWIPSITSCLVLSAPIQEVSASANTKYPDGDTVVLTRDSSTVPSIPEYLEYRLLKALFEILSIPEYLLEWYSIDKTRNFPYFLEHCLFQGTQSIADNTVYSRAPGVGAP